MIISIINLKHILPCPRLLLPLRISTPKSGTKPKILEQHRVTAVLIGGRCRDKRQRSISAQLEQGGAGTLTSGLRVRRRANTGGCIKRGGVSRGLAKKLMV